jgi:glycosyltransferase involved in cell wall biosynthesis
MTETVDVVVFSHNHEDFIEASLRGILAQVTSAKVKVRVHDDASSDGTVQRAESVLRNSGADWELRSAEINRYQFGSRFKYDFALESGPDYIAFLDADDFWIDPHKLEKQLRLMRSHHDVVLCHTAFEAINTLGNIQSFRPLDRYCAEVLPGNLLSETNFIGTLTVMVRRASLPLELPQGFDRLRGVDDYPIWAVITDGQRIGFVDEITARYRLHEHNNYAGQPQAVKNQQLLDALVWIANSVDALSSPLWLESIRSEVLGSKHTIRSRAIRFLNRFRR